MKNPFSIDPSATAAFGAIKENFGVTQDLFKLKKRKGRGVVIGGGTGAPMSIKCLLSLGLETSSVVAMADDGGSTGILREHAHVTAPGDIRKCIAAFAANSHDPLTQAFKYRFEFADGHTLGNLMLAALEDATSSFPAAIDICEKLVHARGHVYPSTLTKIQLKAQQKTGEFIWGQAQASHAPSALEQVWIESSAPIKAYEPACEVIREADVIVLGPGSLFTSIIPNLLVPGIVEAIKESQGICIFVCSLADVQGETLGMSALEHIAALERHGLQGRIDYALVHTPYPLKNDEGLSSEHLLLSEEHQATPVAISYKDACYIEEVLGISLIARNVADSHCPTWHNPRALQDALRLIFDLEYRKPKRKKQVL